MKRLLFLTIVIFLFVSPNNLGAQTADGYILIGDGVAFDGMNKWMDMYVFRLDLTGKKLWRKQYGSYDRDWGDWIAQTADGGYIAIGTCTKCAGNCRNYFVNKLDADGNVQWSKDYGTTAGYEYGRCIRQTSDGGYIMAGDSDWLNQTGELGETDFLVYKVDAAGKKQWRRNYGGASNESWPEIYQSADGGYIMAGTTYSYHHGSNDSDLVIYKLNPAGLKEWRKNFGGIYNEGGGVGGIGLNPTPDGGFILAGSSGSYTHGVPGADTDFLIYKFSASGSKQWRKNLGGTSHDAAKSVHRTTDGGYIVAGWTQSYVHGTGSDYDFLIYKLDATGNKLWRKNLGGINEDQAFSIRQTADGGYIVAGSTKSYIHNYEDMLVYKLNAAGQKEWRKNFGGSQGGCDGNSIRQTVH